jgi:hypothetical protein
MLYEYIMLFATVVLWLSMKDSGAKKAVKKPKLKEVKVEKPKQSVQPVRLKIGDPIQPKWV